MIPTAERLATAHEKGQQALTLVNMMLTRRAILPLSLDAAIALLERATTNLKEVQRNVRPGS